jgi:hypothetical protein
MTTRERLPNRRKSATYHMKLKAGGRDGDDEQAYQVGVGFYKDGRPGEVAGNGSKPI